jgi:hypothetical protein
MRKGRTDLSDSDYIASFKKRCLITSAGCWEWIGHRSRLGYAEGCYRAKNWRLGRLLLTLTRRPLNRNEVAMHSCDNPPCINPDHLRIGTQKENIADAVRKKRMVGQSKSHCDRGHLLEGANLAKAATRRCIVCQRGLRRIRKGWPAHLVWSIPTMPKGVQPPEVKAALCHSCSR